MSHSETESSLAHRAADILPRDHGDDRVQVRRRTLEEEEEEEEEAEVVQELGGGGGRKEREFVCFISLPPRPLVFRGRVVP